MSNVLWDIERVFGDDSTLPSVSSQVPFFQHPTPAATQMNCMQETPTNPVPVVDFSVISDKVLVADLDKLDAALAVVVRGLDMQGRQFMDISFSFINFPHNYLCALSQAIGQLKQGVLTKEEQDDLMREFARVQFVNQVYHGGVVPITNAGFWPSGHPVAIKNCELDMTFPKLMQKRRSFMLQFAEISKLLHFYVVEKADISYRETKFALDKRSSELLSSHESFHGMYCDPHENAEIVELFKESAAFEKNAKASFLGQEKKTSAKLLEDTRIYQQELRQITSLMDGCSAAMTMLLRGQFMHNVQLAEPFTIRLVKEAWENELERRSCA